MAVENGLLDLEAAADGEGDDAIRPLRPDDLALTRLSVEYDPTAEAGDWADYVAEWAEDGKADALQEYVGYCLEVGALPIHRALLLVGSGANGKGTFLGVVRTLLGAENTESIELQTLANEKDAVADFYGAVANIDDDLSSRSLGKGLGMFKKLVAGDPVRARRLYEDGFQFEPTGKHLYAANEVPEVEVPEGDEAFWRRWVLVEFPNHYAPTERDTQLGDQRPSPAARTGTVHQRSRVRTTEVRALAVLGRVGRQVHRRLYRTRPRHRPDHHRGRPPTVRRVVPRERRGRHRSAGVHPEDERRGLRVRRVSPHRRHDTAGLQGPRVHRRGADP